MRLRSGVRAHRPDSGCRAVKSHCFVVPFQSTAALPFGTIVIIIVIWCVITIPLTVFGGIAGKNNK